MTALILAQRKIFSVYWTPRWNEARVWLDSANENGVVTISLLGAGIVTLIVYLGALYAAFNFNLSVQNLAKQETDLSKEVLRIEVLLEGKKTSLAKNDAHVLEFMERVSAIKYLSGEPATALLHQQNQ